MDTYWLRMCYKRGVKIRERRRKEKKINEEYITEKTVKNQQKVITVYDGRMVVFWSYIHTR